MATKHDHLITEILRTTFWTFVFEIRSLVCWVNKEGRKRFFLANIWFMQFCPDFKLVIIYALFPSPRLGQVLSFPPFETNFYPLSTIDADAGHQISLLKCCRQEKNRCLAILTRNNKTLIDIKEILWLPQKILLLNVFVRLVCFPNNLLIDNVSKM